MNSLIEKKNLAFRDVEPGGSPVETFLKVWPRLEPHYGTMVKQLRSALEGALSVRCTISARVKSLSSISKSIERRQIHRKEQYKTVDEIFDDLHDLAGFRIVVDYPSGISLANAFVTKNFQVNSTNLFNADREVPDAWKPTFGSFQSENHHVLLHPGAKYPLSPFCGILFEIQIFSLAESLYNRLAHPLLYKKSSGQLSIKEQKMIDVTHGLSLCYWICLSCMEDRLEGERTEGIPSPIQKVAQLDGDQAVDMESVVKATPYPMPAPGARIPIEKCLDSVKDLSEEAMSADQLHSRLSVLLTGSSQTATTNANYGSGHIVQNYGSGTYNNSNNTYNSGGGNISFAKDDTEDEIRNAFWVTDPQSHKDDIQERKGGLIPESYRWILQGEHFTKWYDQEYSLLWLNGDPGKGKTMSVCGIIDYISASSGSNTILSYFFCDTSDSNSNNATSVLRGIVYSIIFQNSMALSYVRERFKKLSKPLSDQRLAWPVLQKIFIGIFGAIKDQETYLIIDALDECREGRDKLLEFIVKQSSLLPIKWLVSSRKWPVIREILTTFPKLLELSLEDNEKDVSAAVSLYISHQVEELSKIKQYDSQRKKAVEDHLRSKSNNTFLWVSLVCQMLKQIPAWQTMKRLDDSPAGLDALYGRMLEQIQPSSRKEGDLGFDELYAQIISFTLGAFRPLSLDELYCLLDDEEIAVKDLDAIVALCGSFLMIQHRVVYFIHDSAKDYLLNEASGFRFDSKQQHAVLFSQSLGNLTRSLHRNTLHLKSHDTRKVHEGLGSISYQCLHWIPHLIESEPSTATQELMAGSLVDNFLRQKFLLWLEALGHLKSIGLGISGMLKMERMLDNHTSQLKDLVQDEVRFVRYHRFGIEQSPPQGHDDGVGVLAFSNKNYNVATESYDNAIEIWDANNGVLIRTLRHHKGRIRALTFSKNGNLMASSAADGTIKLLDTTSGECTRELIVNDGRSNAWSIAFTHDDQILSCGTHDSVFIWDLKDQTEPHRIGRDDASFAAASVVSSQTNELFLIRDNDVEVWNPVTKMRIRTIRYPVSFSILRRTYGGKSVILSRHGTLLGVIVDNEVKILNPSTLDWVVQISQGSINSAVSPTSDTLALTSGPTINIWDLSSIAHWNSSSPIVDTRPVFSSDGSLAVTGSNTEAELTIWSSCTGDPTAFAGPWHFKWLMPFFSFDGQMLVLPYYKKVHIRHVFKEEVGFMVSFPERHNGNLAFSHDNRWLAVSFRTHVSISQLGHTPFEKIKINSSYYCGVAGCSFSHDSKTLAVHHGKYVDLAPNAKYGSHPIIDQNGTPPLRNSDFAGVVRDSKLQLPRLIVV
ncbi:vegetative incompatibility protein het-e-1 [Fusarium flagelliforme]|uniref:Vegetative incompatibility protein het-e-1 n=1 Tax=Fusarium flagelliforme TaxID=2675880 RepID=A0A395MA44_9HYPO|nr:vegetative incompatibility protein het-e-1 [Fusarium flagelliforme]